MKIAALTTVALLAMAGSASAQTACNRPAVPASVDGATATMDQVVGLKNAVSAFMTASDAYQQCLLSGVEKAREDAKTNKTRFDETISKSADKDIEANQTDKEAIGKAYNAAVKAYRAAHPA